jgi:enoyl-CoA hydratase/carnithine racemase
MHAKVKPAADAPVLVDKRKGIATITLNRAKKYNALSTEVMREIESALASIAKDGSIRVVVIAANGPAFSSGHDLKEMMANRTQEFIGALFDKCSEIMMTIQAMPQPVIAKVQGIATAAGCQLVAQCDLAVASSDAKFATSGINFGLFCATPGVPVSRNVPRKRAFEMLFTGEFIDAQTALSWGLVNRVVPPARLDEEVQKLVETIVDKPAAVCAAGKRLFYEQLESKIGHAYKIASQAITENMLGEDAAEGVGAFIEKRKPDWKK